MPYREFLCFRSTIELRFSFRLDPRIKRIKEEEKAARAAKKAGRSGTATPNNKKAEEEAAKKAAEEEAKRKEEEEKVSGLTASPGHSIGADLCAESARGGEKGQGQGSQRGQEGAESPAGCG